MLAQAALLGNTPGPSHIDDAMTLCYHTLGPISGPATGRSSAWLERAVRDREAGSSNLPAPTCMPSHLHARKRHAGVGRAALRHEVAMPLRRAASPVIGMESRSAVPRPEGRDGGPPEAGLATRAPVLVLCALVWLSGCAREGGRTSEGVRRDPNLLLAFVACSLVPAMELASDRFQTENPDKKVEIQGGEPVNLVARIEKGEVPDLLLLPGEAEIGVLEREGFLDRATREELATLGLAIAVPAASSLTIASHQDLTSRRVKSLTMSTPGITSLGTDGKRALEHTRIWNRLQDKLALQKTPLAALKLLAQGNADACIIYDPCPRLALPVLGAAEGKDEIPPDSVRVAAEMPLGEGKTARVYAELHKRSPNALLAQRLLRLLASEETKSAFAQALLPAPVGEQH